jgi:hypothetical protein
MTERLLEGYRGVKKEGKRWKKKERNSYFGGRIGRRGLYEFRGKVETRQK